MTWFSNRTAAYFRICHLVIAERMEWLSCILKFYAGSGDSDKHNSLIPMI